jgi:hypothetical protein
MEAEVSPLPRELTTPPVTKMCLVIACQSLVCQAKLSLYRLPRREQSPVARGGVRSPEHHKWQPGNVAT